MNRTEIVIPASTNNHIKAHGFVMYDFYNILLLVSFTGIIFYELYEFSENRKIKTP